MTKFSLGSSFLNSQKRQRSDRKPKMLAYSATKLVWINKKTKILIDKEASILYDYTLIMNSDISQEELKYKLNYFPDTGVFTWRDVPENYRFKNKIAGLTTINGYIRIKIYQKHFYAHRLAWLYIHGKLPDNFIDHINKNRADNRIINLRDITCSENGRWRGKDRDNSSGYKGVFGHPESKKWRAQIRKDKITYHIGTFETKEEAALAYNKKAIELFGEFAWLNDI